MKDKWTIPRSFPDTKIAEEYLNPKTNRENTKFTWGVPDMKLIYEYCYSHFGWTEEYTCKIIKPSLEKFLATSSQVNLFLLS